jgi:hypothetical protein
MGVSRRRKHTFNVSLLDDIAALAVWWGTVLGIAVVAVSHTYPKPDLSLVLASPFKFAKMLRKMAEFIVSKNMGDEVRMPFVLGTVLVACGSPSTSDSRPKRHDYDRSALGPLRPSENRRCWRIQLP